ncbi:hypothetical protein M0811_11886 [Anaeramoeba ignava]|uniref:Uncharacterized protein n=1 Tax=Anaeramoeba ignava TaxID=1746090 RepID=A0A9Q0LAZ1_ANAIG|nr:hypothetical protein M0811_11886 [Anaeramoeba ignava]
MMVEFSEIFIWKSLKKTESKCASTNKLFTAILFFIIFLQPLAGNIFLRKTTETENKTMYTVTVVLSFITSIFQFIKLFIEWGKLGYNGNCSYETDDGHLAWGWKTYKSALLPQDFNYFCMTSLPVFFYKPRLFALGFLLIYLSTIAICYFTFHMNSFASTWCWTAIAFLILSILDPWLIQKKSFRSIFKRESQEEEIHAPLDFEYIEVEFDK